MAMEVMGCDEYFAGGCLHHLIVKRRRSVVVVILLRVKVRARKRERSVQDGGGNAVVLEVGVKKREEREREGSAAARVFRCAVRRLQEQSVLAVEVGEIIASSWPGAHTCVWRIRTQEPLPQLSELP